jgi:hypothetical protein
MWLLLSPPAQKWGILSFQNIFQYSFLQLHKRVSIKILQKRITEIHSELLPKSYSISTKKVEIFSKNKKDEIFRNSGGRKAERRSLA